MAQDPNKEPQRWQEIAERASKELDFRKLVQLVEQLCENLDQARATRRAAATDLLKQ